MKSDNQSSDLQPVTRSEAFQLRTLGELSLTDSFGKPVRLRTRKGLMLLACLAVEPDRKWTREQLAGLFWGDRQDEQARNSLRTALADIRRALGKNVIVVEGGSMQVRHGAVATDIGNLRELAEASLDGHAVGRDEIHTGEFFPGFNEDHEAMGWVRATRSLCRDLTERALTRQIAAFSEQGALGDAIERARQLLALDPFREESHRTLMRLYARHGERSKAIAQFRNCSQLLQHELSVEPSPETRLLADEIALQDGIAKSNLRHRNLAHEPEPDLPAGSTAAARGNEDDLSKPSIAVLPFINMSGDAEQDYFADGITEDIVTDLSNVDCLAVVATSSTSLFRNSQARPDQISKELGVHFLLEGSVRKSDQNIRITTKLIDGRTNRQLWAERYDRALVRIFDLQSEIAASVASALKLQLSPTAETSLRARGTESVEAHQHYLRGRAFLKEMTHRSVELAKQSFENAIALDQHYALAFAGLAESITSLGFHYEASSARLADVTSICAKALSIDPNLAEAHCSLGRYHSIFKRFDHAEAEFQKAIEIAPTLQETYLSRGLMYLLVGRSEEAYKPLLRAFELADQDLHTGMMLINCQKAVGRLDERQTTARHVLRLAHKRINLNPYDDRAIYVGAMALQALNREDEALRWANAAAEFDIDDARTTYNVACLFGLLDDIDSALDFLQKTLKLGASKQKIEWMRYHDTDFDSIRQDPRFEAVFRDILVGDQ